MEDERSPCVVSLWNPEEIARRKDSSSEEASNVAPKNTIFTVRVIVSFLIDAA